MSRERCTFCETVVSTTADPNPYEGWFVSYEDAEQLEVVLQKNEGDSYYVRGALNKMGCVKVVLCNSCRKRPSRKE